MQIDRPMQGRILDLVKENLSVNLLSSRSR